MNKIDEITELLARITEGPWKNEFTNVYGMHGEYITRDVSNGEKYVCRLDGSTHAAVRQKANVEFITKSRTLVPELLKLVQMMANDIESAEELISEHLDDVSEKPIRLVSVKCGLRESLAKYKAWKRLS